MSNIVASRFRRALTSSLALIFLANMPHKPHFSIARFLHGSQRAARSLLHSITWHKAAASNQAVFDQQAVASTNTFPSGSSNGNTGISANFNQAVSFTLKHEGGLEEDKCDSGGITNYGISYVYLKGLLARQPQLLSEFSLTNISQINPSIVKRMTEAQAVQIYYTQWWVKGNFGDIENQALASKAFDYSVNMGTSAAIKLLQIAINDQSGTQAVRVDGRLDAATINYMNSLNTVQADQLVYTFDNVASQHYAAIAKRYPCDKKFLTGWLRRANDNTCITA